MNKKIISKVGIRTLSVSLLMSLNSIISFAALIPLGAGRPSPQGRLFEEIQAGNLENVKSLLTARANVHDTNNSGATPLHQAVF